MAARRPAGHGLGAERDLGEHPRLPADGHLSLIDSVLGRLASRPHVEIEPGSDRSPDY